MFQAATHPKVNSTIFNYLKYHNYKVWQGDNVNDLSPKFINFMVIVYHCKRFEWLILNLIMILKMACTIHKII